MDALPREDNLCHSNARSRVAIRGTGLLHRSVLQQIDNSKMPPMPAGTGGMSGPSTFDKGKYTSTTTAVEANN